MYIAYWIKLCKDYQAGFVISFVGTLGSSLITYITCVRSSVLIDIGFAFTKVFAWTPSWHC